MRSFFSKLLLGNWLFLLLISISGMGVVYFVSLVPSSYHIIIFSFYIIFSIYLTFFISYKFAKSVTDQLKILQDKAKAINVGDSPQTNVMTGITELADLSDSIEKMYKRIRGQFIDLELEKEKFNLVLQNLKEGVFAFDNSGNILFQNSSVPKGLVQENSGMRNIEAAIKNRSFLDFLKEHMDSNKEGKISIQIRKKHYSIRLYVLKQNQSACIFIAVILDKTEEKERQMMRELFVQSASHELKTPITSIKGYTETLSYKLKLPENSNENRFLSAIIRNTDRMVRIINDMLTISKLENSLSNFQPEEFELNELIDRMKFTLDGILNPKQQKLILKIPSNLRIYADNILLEHLLLNLLQNASMYSPAKKNIYIIAESEKDKVKIKIKDGGIGIPESEKKRIFERFYRVDKDRSREQGGTGLGLSIVKHIVNLHDGWIEVESKEEKGSTFIVNLPQER